MLHHKETINVYGDGYTNYSDLVIMKCIAPQKHAQLLYIKQK
jgi:hypothetical protein